MIIRRCSVTGTRTRTITTTTLRKTKKRVKNTATSATLTATTLFGLAIFATSTLENENNKNVVDCKQLLRYETKRKNVNVYYNNSNNNNNNNNNERLVFAEKNSYLGEGAFGVVKLSEKNNVPVAVKMIKDKHIRSLEREVNSLSRVRRKGGHKNIVDIIDIYRDENTNKYCIVLEYINGKNVLDNIASKGRFSKQDAQKITKELVEGLIFLHKTANVLHLDLKPENILVDKNTQRPKIIDFGSSKPCTINGNANVRYESLGTVAYSSPELISMRNKKYSNISAASDVWSLGVTLFVMIAGYHPFDKMSQLNNDQVSELIHKMKYDFDDEIWEFYPQAKDLIKKMLIVDASQRISCEEILKHPFVQTWTKNVHKKNNNSFVMFQETLSMLSEYRESLSQHAFNTTIILL